MPGLINGSDDGSQTEPIQTSSNVNPTEVSVSSLAERNSAVTASTVVGTVFIVSGEGGRTSRHTYRGVVDGQHRFYIPSEGDAEDLDPQAPQYVSSGE